MAAETGLSGGIERMAGDERNSDMADRLRLRDRAESGEDQDDEDQGRGSRSKKAEGDDKKKSDKDDKSDKHDKNDKDDEGDGEKEHKRSVWPLVLLGVAIVIAAIVGLIYWLATRNEETTDDAYTDGRAVLIAPHVSGYVTVLAVDDNQLVHKGDLLVQIEPRDYIASRDQAAGQVLAAEAQLDNAKTALEKALTVYPAQLALAQGQLEQARGRLFQAQAEYHRQHTIDRAATTQQSVDASSASLQVAEGQVRQAEAQVREAELVAQNIAQAQAQVRQLEGQAGEAHGRLAQAELNVGYTRVIAPQDGWITRRNVETGDYLQAGGQIMAVVTPEVWITANFKETALARLRPGQDVRIAVDSYPRLKLVGHVDSIQLGSGQRFTAFPPENATGNWVKIVQRVPVKIVIDRGMDPNAPLPLGISVEPTVTVK
jgi:membrane fusion protein (multidrug efflux system)